MLGANTTWQFFQDNFEELKGKLASASPSLMEAVVYCCCRGIATEARADQVEAFFVAHPLPQCSSGIAQMLEGMRNNGKFFSKLREMSDALA